MKYKVQYHYYDEHKNFLKSTKEIVAEGYQVWPDGKALFYGKDDKYFESFYPGFWDWIEEVGED